MNDYHVHTALCGHADGTTREYVERAVAAGLAELGFADHLPMVRKWEPGLTMAPAQLEGYVAEVRALADEFRGDLRVLLGVELDYSDDTEDEVAALLAAYDFDYVIGSVHHVDDFGFDHPRNREAIAPYGVDRIYLESYRLLALAARSGLVTVLGHIDLPKKFGHRPADAAAVTAAARETLAAARAAGAALEINTAGWRMPVGEAYPSFDLLTEAASLGLALTIGSDAHRPADVAGDFERAAALARAAGFTSTLRLSDGGEEALP